MLKDPTLVLAKIEESYGVDPVPVQATEAILCGAPEIEFVTRKLDRPNVQAFLGSRPKAIVGESLKIKFTTEVKGHGTAGGLPEIGVLFRGCGMSQTIDIATQGASLTFAETGKTITRAAGSFVTDGFRIGDKVTSDASLNAGPFTVTDVAALVLTVSEAVVDEGPVSKAVTGKRVTYAPQDDIEGPSITIYFWQDGILHKLCGCRGTGDLSAPAGEIATINWEFTGLYAIPEDDAIPTDAVFSSVDPPQVVSAGFVLGSYEATIANFNLKMGNGIAKRPDVNAATGFLAHFINSRAATGEIDPEATDLATFNPVSLLTNGTEQAMEITIGQAAGNRMVVVCPRVVLDDAKYADRESLLAYTIPLLICPSSGEDDFSFIFN